MIVSQFSKIGRGHPFQNSIDLHFPVISTKEYVVGATVHIKGKISPQNKAIAHASLMFNIQTPFSRGVRVRRQTPGIRGLGVKLGMIVFLRTPNIFTSLC